MHRPAVATSLIVFALIIAACSGSTSPSTGDGAAATEVAAPDDPATAAAAGNPAETATDVDTGGAVDAPTIADATYSSGSAHVEVSGGTQLTLDAPLAVGMSMTGAGATLLMYPAEGSEGELFSISSSPETGLGFTLQMPGLVTGGDSSACPIELTQNDASGIAGRFDCSGLDALLGAVGGSVNVKATFSATK
jgi:hypothetical protein